MTLTGSFRELVQRRVARDAEFGRELLRGGIESMLAGDLETGKAVLRNYIKGTVGFEQLGSDIEMQPKSLIRMFGPRGNPQARNLFKVIEYLLKHSGIELHVVSRTRRPGQAEGRRSMPGRRGRSPQVKLPMRQAV